MIFSLNCVSTRHTKNFKKSPEAGKFGNLITAITKLAWPLVIGWAWLAL